jgi:hypothetical protein
MSGGMSDPLRSTACSFSIFGVNFLPYRNFFLETADKIGLIVRVSGDLLFYRD